MKECSRCHKTKPVSEFYKKAGRARGVASECKECGKSVRLAWVNKNRDKVRGYSRKANLKRYRTRKEAAIMAAGGKCSMCGYDRYVGALHFHHVTPKTAAPQKLLSKVSLTEQEQRELDSCVLLCANCHAEIHGRERVVCKNLKTGSGTN